MNPDYLKNQKLQLRYIIPIIILLISLSPVYGQKNKASTQFEEDWASLRKHQIPDWLIEAKFGIYAHWGISTIKYIEGNENLSNDEAISLFKADKFDADNWAELFEKAGAKFGGVIGWHGSNYIHWDSQYSDYNSAKLNPNIDIVGEISQAIKQRNMKFLVSYHSISGDDWVKYAKEGVDKYDPDIFWVDASFGGTKGGNHLKTTKNTKFIGQQETLKPVFEEKYQREFITYYYNQALKNQKEVAFVYKSNDIPPGVGMRDLENGLLNETAYDVWMTDMDMNVPPDWETHGWFYRDGVPLRSTNELVDMLVDVVSKNGVFLLNVPPLADGTFPVEVGNRLAELGDWLKQNGEAIYGTSPWFIYGEGPTEIETGNYTFHHNNHFAKIQFTREDIRFTVKGNDLYVTCLGKPESELMIRSLSSEFKLRSGDIISISHLTSGDQIDYEHNEDGLLLDLRATKLDDHANVFKIHLNF